jgi:hypothetical protein
MAKRIVRIMMKGSMKNRHNILAGLFGLGALVFLSSMPPLAHAAEEQNSYSTPEKAVDALIFASRHNHTEQLIKILGPGSEKLVNSGDDVADQQGRERFVAAYDKSHTIEAQADGRDILTVGDEGWPVPIPLVQGDKGWRFDTQAGEEEIVNRRIGRNELNVIQVCRTFVDAEREYGMQHVLADGKHEYAQRFRSHEGAHDGLYWEVKDGEAESPLGPLLASAAAEGYSDKAALSQHEPYHGYYYKILKSQGSHAAGGERDYVKDGHMTDGFALIAFPANYGDTGVMSFIVNQNGIVYEKNLGPDTLDVATDMTAYDPDDDWKIVQ